MLKENPVYFMEVYVQPPLSDAQTAHALAPDILDAPQADLAQANKCVNAYRYWLTTSVREV